MQLSAKLFLEHNGNYILGPGRLELLRSIVALGSLRKAAQKQGMSYRWAWGRLKDAEAALGIALLAADSSGKAKVLTPEALELLAWFARTEAALARALAQADAARPEFLDQQTVVARDEFLSSGKEDEPFMQGVYSFGTRPK